jgi:RNA polymerase sigma-70 factor, ECF subfamily
MNEGELARFHAGDALLFRDLYTRHAPVLYGLVRGYARDGDEASDLLQEVWVRIFRKRARFEGRGSFLAWALVLARRVCISRVTTVAARRMEVGMDALDEIAGAAPPESGTEQTRGLLREALFSLSDRQREVVVSRLVEGLNTREVAERLGCAEGTVKATLHQALARLRTLLSGIPR